jgi:hypothetical protein
MWSPWSAWRQMAKALVWRGEVAPRGQGECHGQVWPAHLWARRHSSFVLPFLTPSLPPSKPPTDNSKAAGDLDGSITPSLKYLVHTKWTRDSQQVINLFRTPDTITGSSPTESIPFLSLLPYLYVNRTDGTIIRDVRGWSSEYSGADDDAVFTVMSTTVYQNAISSRLMYNLWGGRSISAFILTELL